MSIADNFQDTARPEGGNGRMSILIRKFGGSHFIFERSDANFPPKNSIWWYLMIAMNYQEFLAQNGFGILGIKLDAIDLRDSCEYFWWWTFWSDWKLDLLPLTWTSVESRWNFGTPSWSTSLGWKPPIRFDWNHSASVFLQKSQLSPTVELFKYHKSSSITDYLIFAISNLRHPHLKRLFSEGILPK